MRISCCFRKRSAPTQTPAPGLARGYQNFGVVMVRNGLLCDPPPGRCQGSKLAVSMLPFLLPQSPFLHRWPGRARGCSFFGLLRRTTWHDLYIQPRPGSMVQRLGDDSSLDDEDQHFRSSPGLPSSFLFRLIIVSAPLASAHFLSSPSFRSSWMLVNPLPFIASSKASSQGFARAPCWQAWTWMEARQAQAMSRTTLRLKWHALASRQHIWQCLI